MKNEPRKKTNLSLIKTLKRRQISALPKGIYISGFRIYIHPFGVGGESTLLISQIYSRHLVLFHPEVFRYFGRNKSATLNPLGIFRWCS